MSKESSSNTPELAAQRKLGIKLAREYGGPKTLDIIKDVSSGYDAIFQAAAEEIGPERLAEIVLKEHPDWALQVILNVPVLADNAGLVEKAMAAAKGAAAAPCGPQADAATGVGAVGVNLVWGSVMYTCQFTQFWQAGPDVIQPLATGRPPSDWFWSPKMDITYHSGYEYNCNRFPVKGSTVVPAPGDPVWVHLSINGGDSPGPAARP